MSGEQLTDVGEGITLCHESFGDPEAPPLLLVMGLGTQMIAWHRDFCSQLAERGFHVVRFDNRDAGLSTHVEGKPVTIPQVFTRRVPDSAYDLSDMADDTARLIDALSLGPVHVVGASMGGMIGQTLAAKHADKVRSLVSIMSNTGSRWTGQPALGAYRIFLKEAPTEREAFVEHVVELFKVIGSRGLEADEEHLRYVASHSLDRSDDVEGTGRQLGAIVKTGNRVPMLREIRVPTLVVHGTDDRLVRPSGGRATAKAIPGAELMLIDGMGHDLPQGAWPQILDGIERTAARAHRAADVRAAA